jgi:hypothetical protein
MTVICVIAGRGLTPDSVYCRNPFPVKTRSGLRLRSRVGPEQGQGQVMEGEAF